MFERYTEPARRAIFFARASASQLGSPKIESEHLLLGLLRESQSIVNLYLQQELNAESLRTELLRKNPAQKMIPTNEDLPVSEECIHVFEFSSEEAETLGDQYVDTTHLILGILREKHCVAAKILREHGLQSGFSEPAEEGNTSIDAVPQNQTGKTIEFLDANTLERIATCQNLPLLPRVAEKIAIQSKEGLRQSYRVQAVTWEFEQDTDLVGLKVVSVLLERNS